MQNVMPAINLVPTRKVSIAGAMRVMIEGSMVTYKYWDTVPQLTAGI
jgi:hypothetical protein